MTPLERKFRGGRGRGLKVKNLPWGGYGYFLEQHNVENSAMDWHPIQGGVEILLVT